MNMFQSIVYNVLSALHLNPETDDLSWIIFKIILKLNTFVLVYLCWRRTPNGEGSWPLTWGTKSITTSPDVKESNDNTKCTGCCNHPCKHKRQHHRRSRCNNREGGYSLKQVLEDAGIHNIQDEMISATHRIGKEGVDTKSKKGGGSKTKKRSPEPGIQEQQPVALGVQGGEVPGSLSRRTPRKLMDGDNFQAYKNPIYNDFQKCKK